MINMVPLLRVLAVCTFILQAAAGAQDDQFLPISLEDRIKHFSGVSVDGLGKKQSSEQLSLVRTQQQQFQGVQPRPQQQPQPLSPQIRPQQQQFQSQLQQFQPQQQQFQAQQQQFQPQQQQFQPQQQQFQAQKQQFQPQQQQFQPQQQQFQPQKQQFPVQQQQFQQQQVPPPQQQFQQQQQQNSQSVQQFQSFPPGAQVPSPNLQVATPEHIRQSQQEANVRQPEQPFTVFGQPSQPTAPVSTQFRKPSANQFQQLASQTTFQPSASNSQPRQFQQNINQFQQPEQSRPFTVFNDDGTFSQQSSARSFQSQGQSQFLQELPRSSQQFSPAQPLVGVFDQIKSAINTGRRFTAQQVQFPQVPQTTTLPPPPPTTTTQPPPKFMPLTAVPPGSEQISTHNKSEEIVKTQGKKLMVEKTTTHKPQVDKTKDVMKDKKKETPVLKVDNSSDVTKDKKKKKPGLVDLIRKVVIQTIGDKDQNQSLRTSKPKTSKPKNNKDQKDKIETASIVEELNNILFLLSQPSSSKAAAPVKPSRKKPADNSLIRIQEKILGLSSASKEPITEEDISEETNAEDFSDLLKLLSNKKEDVDSKTSLSVLHKKLAKLSGENSEEETSLNKMIENLLPSVTKDKSVEKEKKEENSDLSAVQEALSTLLGKNPSDEAKLSPEVFSVVLQLDNFFKEEEAQMSKKISKVENLVEEALGFIDGAVTRREHAEKRLIDGEAVLDYDEYYEDILDSLDLSPSQLRTLLKSNQNS